MREGEADVVLGARSAVFAPVPGSGCRGGRGARRLVQAGRHPALRRAPGRRPAGPRAPGRPSSTAPPPPGPRPGGRFRGARCRRAPDGSSAPRIEVVDMRRQGAGPVSRPLAAGAPRGRRCRGEKADAAGHPPRVRADGPLPRVRLDRPLPRLRRRPRPPRGAAPPRLPPLRPRRAGARGVPVAAAPPALARQGIGVPGARARRWPGSCPRRAWCAWTARARPAAGPCARLLDEFARPGPAILLGTQMVAKGHDLPHVTVAAAVDADAPLQHAGFRSEERAFALIVQLAGRAGRRGEAARVHRAGLRARGPRGAARRAPRRGGVPRRGARAPPRPRAAALRAPGARSWWRASARTRWPRRPRAWPPTCGPRRPTSGCWARPPCTACAAAPGGPCSSGPRGPPRRRPPCGPPSTRPPPTCGAPGCASPVNVNPQEA